jgi:hypothetical protein
MALGVGDGLCRFGDSIVLLLFWILALVGGSTVAYYFLDQLNNGNDTKVSQSWTHSFEFAVGSLVSNRPETIKATGFATDLLSPIETLLGILLAGLLGFVIASKLRQG